MFRKRLAASAAAAPLLILASAAYAETTITDTRTTGVSTGTINNGAADDIKITTSGKVKPTTGGTSGNIAGAVTINSPNDVLNEGEISTKEVDYIAGIKVNAGTVGDVTNKGQISLIDDYEATDTDKDGNLDGPFAEGTGRFGILVQGAMTGNVVNDIGGTITIEGNDSAGIRVEGPLTGNLINRSSISVTGTNARGIEVLAPVTGRVEVRGAVTTTGENAVGLAVDDVSGQLLIQGSIATRGYRYASRPSDPEDRANLDPDDKLQSGSAVVVAGNIGGGILLDTAPTSSTYDGDNDGIPNHFDEDDDNDGVKDTTDEDDDNDGVKDTEDKDLDNDGVDDTLEGSASITIAGGAPALAIGSTTEAITIGKVAATGDDAYGLVVRGVITANGTLDDISATGIRVGTSAGQTTTIEGGMKVQGAVNAIAFNNNAQAIHLMNGAVVDEIVLDGSVFASMQATSKPLAQENAFSAYGVLINQGATVDSIKNSGVITTVVGGEKGDAVAIRDLSGTVTNLTNTGVITAIVAPNDDADDTDDTDVNPGNEQITGKAIAIDVRFAQQGVTITQDGVDDGDDDFDPETDDLDTDGDGVDDADEPSITGNIYFGAFNDTLNLKNGKFRGDLSFGDGADVYNLTGGTVATAITEAEGALRDSDGDLTVNVGRAKLTITNAEVIQGTAVNIGSDSQVIFTADPDAGTNTRFEVANANIANGAKIGLKLTDLIDGPERYVVIKTDTPGGLIVGNLDQSLTGNAPYMFVAQAGADATAGEVFVDVRRRTATEIGLNASETAAFDLVYASLGLDPAFRDAFLAAEDRQKFLDLYDQMLPDQGEGIFAALDNITRAMSRLTATRPDLRQRYGPDSFWVQEVNTQVMRNAGVTLGSETKAFGFAGGYESMGADGGALGATLAFITAEERDDVAKVGEETSVSLLEAGIYWRRSIGKFTINARGSGGYAWFDGDRMFIDPDTDLISEANSDWTGFTGAASLSASYEAGFGRYYLRPTVSADYIYVNEGERRENSKSEAHELIIEGRTSSRLSATAQLAFGATFGRDLWWRPEFRIGYRHHLAGEIGDTVYTNPNLPALAKTVLSPTEPGDGAMIVGLSIKAGTAMSYVAIEGEYEVLDDEDIYNLQLAGRMMF